MLFLKTFGGLSVDVDGTPGTGAGQQRKTLALLALLAVAGRRGLSRDKVSAFLWPDGDTEHARRDHRVHNLESITKQHPRDIFWGGERCQHIFSAFRPIIMIARRV